MLPERLETVPETAARWQKSTRAMQRLLKRLVREGGSGIYIVGKSYRVDPEEFAKNFRKGQGR